MTQIIEFFVSFMNDLWYTVFDSVNFEIAGVSVSLGAIVLGFLCISMIISFFWKGARG